MKKSMIAAMAALLSASALPTIAEDVSDSGAGARIDYLSADGKRLFSAYPQDNNALFYITREQDLLKIIHGYSDDAVSDIRFVQWGQESYPLNLTTDNSDGEIKVEISFGAESEEANGGRHFLKAADTEEVKCGTDFTLAITMPDGEIPAVRITDLYSHPDMDFEISSFGPDAYLSSALNFSDNYFWNPENRKYLLSQYDSTGWFVRDKENPNRWYFSYYMPNEPMKIEVYSAPRDAEWLSRFMECSENMFFRPRTICGPMYDCGDPYISTVLGDYYSADMVSGWMNVAPAWADSEVLHTLASTYVCTIPWKTAFSLIDSSNALMKILDRFVLTQAELENAKATCLTYRAYGYWRLLQIYGKRWSDSDNGSAYCAPLYTEFTDHNLPLATMKEIADQCYSDLREAIGLFAKNDFKRKKISEPDADVARALLVRVAMLREDWTTALEAAETILSDRPLTTNAELTDGFLTVTPAWIWGSEEACGYAQPQVFTACNGVYPATWNMGCNAIDVDLYRSIPEKDVRRQLFAMPDNMGGIIARWSTWYSGKTVSEHLTVAGNNIARMYENRKPEKAVGSAFFAENYYYVPVQFGSQVKFYAGDLFETGATPVLFMRSDEMLLSAAEACWHLNDEAKARELLTRLNSMRMSDYACASTGEALLDEIRLTRRIELWGEGHGWFDFKRWNLPIKRKLWVEGDETSGNWPSVTWSGRTEEPISASNGFRCVIPRAAVQFNPLIDISKMGYVKADGYESAENAPVARKIGKDNGKSLLNAVPCTPAKFDTDILMP